MSDSGSAVLVGIDAQRSFDEFVAAEHSALFATARLLVGRADVAEEIVQDAFLAAFRRWETVRSLDRPGAWARRVVINSSISTLRRRRAELVALTRLSGRGSESLVDPEVDEFAARVSRLPRQTAQAMALRYGADLSVREVAQRMGLTEHAARAVLHRGRTALREGWHQTKQEELDEQASTKHAGSRR